MKHDLLEWTALGTLVGVVVFLIYLLIFIHDIPYQVAKKRNHPQQDAIFVGCWLSLFTLHLMWPLLFIWAVSRSSSIAPVPPGNPPSNQETTSDRFTRLEKALADLQKQHRRTQDHPPTSGTS